MDDTLALLDYSAPMNVGFTMSLVVGVMVLGFGVLAVIAAMVVRLVQFSMAQREEVARVHAGAARPLSPGPSRVVRGTVDLDDANDVAIEVDIVQRVKNRSSKNSRWHTWEEERRSIVVRPFYLVREDGEAVLVEPDDTALVVDALETELPPAMPMLRRRRADVRRGEVFYAYGNLHVGAHPRARGAYRDGARGYVLKPPRTQRMLFATEMIAERYKARIRTLTWMSAMLFALFLLTHAVLTFSFARATWLGETGDATLERLSTYTTSNKGRTTVHYVVAARAEDGRFINGEVPSATYFTLQKAEKRPGVVKVPVVLAPGSESTSYLGFQPTLNGVGLFVVLAAWLLGLGACWSAYQSKIAWYDRRKLGEYGGSDHWVELR